jgi:MFS family permease
MIISAGTIISSLLSDRMLHKFGTGKITAFSTFLTAIALLGFSISNQYWMLVLWAIPYGLGAGGVDSVLNNYVAIHYKAQHMSWLHCMWGVGASISPYIMSYALVKLSNWSYGYLLVSIIQIALSLFLFMSLPLWNKGVKNNVGTENSNGTKPMTFKEIFSTSGALAAFIAFFAYCALELTASLWASSYLVETRGVLPETAATLACLVYLGITIGRAINGFLAMKLKDRLLVRLGIGIVALGIILIILPLNTEFAIIGLFIMGLGCAPIYPCIMHMTPEIFGADKSQAMIGMQMAFAYTGFLLMPSLFGWLAEYLTFSILPIYLLALLVVILIMHEKIVKQTR